MGKSFGKKFSLKWQYRILKIVEFFALFVSVIFLVLWVKDPDGPYEPFFASATTIFVSTEIYRRYFYNYRKKKRLTSADEHVKVNYNPKNTSFVRFKNKGNQRNGNIGLIFYQLQITNISDRPFTIKSVNLEYEFKGKTVNEISHVIVTGSVYSPTEKEYVDTIIHQSSKNQVFFMGWKNLRVEINKNRVLNHGEILSGSTLYLLDFNSSDEIADISNLRLIVEDYSGNMSSHPFSIEDHWKRFIDAGFIEPRQFRKDEKGEIEFW